MSEPVKYPELIMPDNVERTAVTVWSLGIPLDADLYRPKGLTDSDRVPAVALTHGWGGDKKTAERYAALFAASGMICLSLTQSSWYGSAGRLSPLSTDVDQDLQGEAEVRVNVAREVVDPIDWADNLRACVDYLVGEPNVDVERLGLWGTSYGGGSAVYAAASDERIKALTIQVPMVFDMPAEMKPLAKQRATEIARGDIAPIPQGIDPFGPMSGTPHLARMLRYQISAAVAQLNIPTLIVDAGNEELFDINHSGGAAYQVLKDKGVAPVYYEVIDGIDHYGIYFGGFERGSKLAHDWLQQYL